MSSHTSSAIKLGVAIAVCFLVILLQFQGVKAKEFAAYFPPLQIHPLPPTLLRWETDTHVGDYFSEVKSTAAGYLVWSEFPVKIYLDRPENFQDTSASDRRFQQWVNAVEQAIQEWHIYLPLVEIQQPELADIIIKREQPPLGVQINRETGQVEKLRARSAQTSYEFSIRAENPPVLWHRMTIRINPGMSEQSIRSTTRHEIGHALGIWGHSQAETDVMYFSQVRTSPSISPRDINTLKKIYQQPTRLGWQVSTKKLNKMNSYLNRFDNKYLDR